MSSIPTPRKQLSTDALIARIRQHFEHIDDRSGNPTTTIRLADALMAGFALFSLKDPSLLAFDQRRVDDADHPHLRTIAVLDALYANAPVIADLRAAHVRWIIRVKESHMS